MPDRADGETAAMRAATRGTSQTEMGRITTKTRMKSIVSAV